MRAIYDYFGSIKSFSRNARLFLIASFAGALYQSVFMVLGNLYILQSGLTETFLGTMVSVTSFASVIFGLPAGLLSDRIGRRRALVIAACVIAAMQLLIILFPSAVVILTATFLGGAASAVMMVSSSPFLAENSTREERAHLFSISSASYTVSGVAGSFLGGVLPVLWSRIMQTSVDSAPVYRATLLTAFTLLAAAIIPYFLIQDKHSSRTQGASFSLRLARPKLLGQLVVPELFMGLGAGLVIPFLNVYFAKQLQATASQIGFIFSVMSLVTTIGILGAPFLGKKYGMVGATVLTRLLSVPLLIVIALSNNLWFAAVAAWLRSALMNMSNPIVGSFTMEIIEPSERATVSSILSMTWNLGWGISARLAGHIMRTYSYRLPYFFTAILYTISAITFYRFFASREKELTATVAD